MSSISHRQLGLTGIDVSVLSLGTAGFGNPMRSMTQVEANDIITTSLNHGINLFDTAPWYGHGKAESLLGGALRDKPRGTYVVSTKCGRYDRDVGGMFDFRAETILSRFDDSIQRLGLDYVDILQVHDPEFCPSIDIVLYETLPALQQLKERGKIKFIGITGYPLALQRDIISRSPVKIDTSLVYCHYGLLDTSLLSSGFKDVLDVNQIGLINASPLSMGLLTDAGPPSWHPALPETKHLCQRASEHCQQRGVNISKLALKFSLACDDIPTTLCSVDHLDMLNQNIETVTKPLTTLELEVLDELQNQFFTKNHEWHQEEVNKYWIKLGKKLLLENLYPSYKITKVI